MYQLELLFDGFLFCTLIFSLFPRSGMWNGEYKFGSCYLGLVLIILFCMFAVIDTDYEHYGDIYKRYTQYNELGHLEPFYGALMDVSSTYTMFRTLVWGTASLLFYKTIERLGLPIRYTLFLFVPIYLLTFSYARVSLALAVFFYGYSFLIKPHCYYKLNSFIVGGLLIFVSYFLHKSMLFMIILFPFSFFKLRKVYIYAALAFIPICITFLNTDFARIMTSGNLLDADSMQFTSFSSYSNKKDTIKGIGILISRVLSWGGLYYLLVEFVRTYFREEELDKPFSRILNLVFISLIVTLPFFFMKGTNQILFYRFLYMSYIPVILIISYLSSNSMVTNGLRNAMIVTAFGGIYTFLYKFYLQAMVIF